MKSEEFEITEEIAIRLAAISTATLQNTDRTIQDRIDKSNPYWTVAYGDVCRAVDREMSIRKAYTAKCREVEELRKALARLMPDLQGVSKTYARDILKKHQQRDDNPKGGSGDQR